MCFIFPTFYLRWDDDTCVLFFFLRLGMMIFLSHFTLRSTYDFGTAC
jgi:hypothetical protein